MSTRVPTLVPSATAGPTGIHSSSAPLLTTRVARAHLDAMAAGDAPYRVLVVGTSGSGKSRMLRHLRRTLADSGTTAVRAQSAAQITALPAGVVLFVDDPHLLPEAMLVAIATRIADPDAAIVLTARRWPQSNTLTQIIHTLERTQPAIVLGHVGHADLEALSPDGGEALAATCIDAILEFTGGVSWLVAESLSIHTAFDCTLDPRHGQLREALYDVIAHRLGSVDAGLRALVEGRSLGLGLNASTPGGTLDDELTMAGITEGLLLRNGQVVPVVASAARTTVPVERIVDAFANRSRDAADDASLGQLLEGIREPRVAEALLHQGDAVAPHDPGRAAELYRGASAAGAAESAVAIRQAEIAWSLGDVEAASAALDAVSIDVDDPDHDRAAHTAAAIWAARGLATMSDAVYGSFSSSRSEIATQHPGGAAPHGETGAHAAIASLAVADRRALLEAAAPSPGRTMPSTLDVSMHLLTRGIRDSLTGSAQSALTDMVRAAEMYSAAGAAGPIPELPAVIAALTAINVGELDVAHSVLERAVREKHGGGWAQDRLVLWRAWVALQQEQAHEVEEAVRAIAPTARALSPRDRLLFDAITLAIARRYHDSAALVTAWRGSRESLLRARFDVFSQLPLGEFVLSAARVGESERMQPHLTDSLAQVERLGSPPVWSAHLHWTGIQQGILRGRPDDLAPHARALVAAAPHSRLAAMMAQAGRVWTSVLAGTVDADVVEKSALGLASVGLAWDGARLAGHGASRTDDRRAISRLLACARRLHPREEMRPTPAEDDVATAPAKTRSYDELSPREREVAALVIEGKTYAEIGSAIFISPRTAEHHIARIRRRLGATTRSDLITKLRLVIAEGGDDADTASSGADGVDAGGSDDHRLSPAKRASA